MQTYCQNYIRWAIVGLDIRWAIVGLAFFAWAMPTRAASATLVWDASPDAATPGAVAGYNIYYSTNSFTALPADVATNPTFTRISVSGATTTTTAINNLADGQVYYCGITAFNSYGGESVVSNVLQFTAGASTSNVPPTVSLTSPVNDASFKSIDTVTLAANATDSDGTISKVDFQDGGVLIGSSTVSPYTLTANFAAGPHSLTAVATDNSGVSTTSVAVTINVIVNAAPTVNLTSPASGATFKTIDAVTITAAASDSDGTIAKVDFLDGSTLLGSVGTAPYTLTKTFTAGTHSISAVAVDNSGASAISASANISVSANVAPSVSISSPANNSTAKTVDTVTITATASDSDGTVSKVEFFDGATSLGVLTASPYTTSKTFTAGSHSITAKATDNNNAVTTSTAVTVTVSANTPPTVTLTAPSNGSTVKTVDNVVLAATASDSDGTVSKVEFFDGATRLGTVTSAPYTITNTFSGGTHTLTAVATDDNSASTTSSSVGITSVTNQPPTVSITAPANNSSFKDTDTVTISATASDPDGTIQTVSFYDGSNTNFIGGDSTAPYTITKKFAAGSHSLIAGTIDNNGASKGSAAVVINVLANVSPTITLTSPSNNSSVKTVDNVTISATASDSDGTISKVEFFDGATLIGTSTTAPYSISKTFASGSHTVTAKATDDSGATTTSTAATLTAAANVAPTVTLTAPANNTSFKVTDTVTLSATATDSDGSVTKVEFFDGTTLVGTKSASPFSITATFAAGSHTITAKATDDSAATTTSTAVAVNVAANVPPTVSLTAPASNVSVKTTDSVTITASASDSDGTVAKVEFFDGANLLATSTSAPYTTSKSFSAGSHTITAKATDDSGASTTSTAVTVTAAANVAPTVAITAPANSATVKTTDTVTITASASDSDGTVSKVEFFDGTTSLGSVAASPFTISKTFAAGSHSLTAVATDNNGTTTTSTAVTISATANTPPTVAITSPSNNASFKTTDNITITASASDSDGTISKVEFFDGTTLLATSTTSPYTTSKTLAAGSHTLTAKATDNASGSTTSAAVIINVTANAAPTVTLTSPTGGATLSSTDPITFSATAADSDGSVSKVEFFDGATLLASVTASPYTASKILAAGSHTITAKATDNLSATATSAAATISVINNTPPTAVLNTPTNSATFMTNTMVTFSATATDTDGTIAKVDFLDGATLLGSVTTSPYSIIASFSTGGAHTISARATDNVGGTGSSTNITINIVTNNALPTVTLTSPTNNAVFDTSMTISLSATAGDTDGTIAKVEFFAGATLLGSATSSPYAISGTFSAGTYSITAKATDNLGGTTTSAAATITVNTSSGPKPPKNLKLILNEQSPLYIREKRSLFADAGRGIYWSKYRGAS